MGNYNRDNQSGGNRNFGKPRFNNDRPDMHKATCASCGKICEVPFRPTGSKPVYCKDCYQNVQGAESHRSESRSFDRPRSEERQMYDAVCSTCGNSCQIPFRPSPGRDVFCSRCFEKNEGAETHRPGRSFDRPSFNRDENRGRSNDAPNYKAQFEALNTKLDKILNLLNPVEDVVLESTLDEKVIDEIVEEVEKVQEEIAAAKKEAPKKTKAAAKKAPAKTKKVAAPKKK